MEIVIDKCLEGSVWKAHGDLPIGNRTVSVDFLVKYHADTKKAELHLDVKFPTLVEGKPVLKYTNASVSDVPELKEGLKLNFRKFFVNISNKAI